MGIRILLADDHEVIREGLHALLFRQADFEVISCVANGKEAIDEAWRTMPDVIVMDVRMPGMNGVEATKKILKVLPDTKVLCLSMHRNAVCVRSAIDAGASGYLLKDCAIEEIVKAVRAVYDGQRYLSPDVVDLVADDDRRAGLSEE